MTSTPRPIDVGEYRHIVILTGAGISVASGLRPYRGPGGLWEEEGVAELATPAAFERDPLAVWKLFGSVRAQAAKAMPNAAHMALASFEASQASGDTLTIITQNIDGLHQRAGSKNVIEIHGTVFQSRCSVESCKLESFRDDETHEDAVPTCPLCGATLRPDVVLFDEGIPGGVEWHAKRALRECELFIAVGTSGTVSPASNFVRGAEYAEARTVLVNLEPMSPRHPSFHEEYLGRAEELLPHLLGRTGR